MGRTGTAGARRLDFEAVQPGTGFRRGLRLAAAAPGPRGPEKYRIFDLKRRRAQIRARRLLGLVG